MAKGYSLPNMDLALEKGIGLDKFRIKIQGAISLEICLCSISTVFSQLIIQSFRIYPTKLKFRRNQCITISIEFELITQDLFA